MINDLGEIQLSFKVKDITYTVLETKRGSQNSVWAARDRIRNEQTGEIRENSRKQWKTIFDNFK